jgi:hypothetical protein
MLACFLDALPTAFLACADLDDAQSHPRVFGLPLSIAILAVTLAVPGLLDRHVEDRQYDSMKGRIARKTGAFTCFGS